MTPASAASTAAVVSGVSPSPEGNKAAARLHFIPDDPFDTSSFPATLETEGDPSLSVPAGGGITTTGPSGNTARVAVPNLRSGLTTVHGVDGIFLPEEIDALLDRRANSDETSQAAVKTAGSG